MPIDAGLCTFSDMYKLNIDDFADMNEILTVRYENKKKAHKSAEAKQKRNR